MNIVYVCNEYPPAPHGGIGTFMRTIAQALARKGHRITIVGLGDQSGERLDGEVRVVSIKRASIPRLSWLIDRARIYRWLRRAVRAGECDVVEVPDYEGLLPFPFSACPVVVRLHLSATADYRLSGLRPRPGVFVSEHLTHRLHRHWIAVSEYALRLAIENFGLQPGDVRTIYYPIAFNAGPAAMPPGLPSQFVLFAGYVCDRKGAYTVARAARIFLERQPDLHLVFLGELPVEDGIPADERIRSIVPGSLSARVHCYGRVSRETVLACMTRARVFLFPSRLECNPLVVGEAMLAGTPVITSTCDPFPEYLSHGETGLLVPPDDPEALAGAVLQVLESPALSARLVEHARALVTSRFSLDGCVIASEQFYADLLGAGPGTGPMVAAGSVVQRSSEAAAQ
jgi:glycosyltransferase involved in cell wall biosynthesis